MRDRLATAHTLAFLHALSAVGDLEHARARDMEVPSLHCLHDLRQVALAQALARIRREERRLQIVEGEMAVGAAVGVLWTWLVLREDLLAAIRLIS